jgi:ssDNA-binding Zn-finger/Zn-ribbon topoisomerase 1
MEQVIKKALYHFDLGNVHRPTKREADDECLYCPKCRETMMPMRNRFNHLHRCSNPECGFFLREDQVIR